MHALATAKAKLMNDMLGLVTNPRILSPTGGKPPAMLLHLCECVRGPNIWREKTKCCVRLHGAYA